MSGFGAANFAIRGAALTYGTHPTVNLGIGWLRGFLSDADDG
jgi:hypothetical protein